MRFWDFQPLYFVIRCHPSFFRCHNEAFHVVGSRGWTGAFRICIHHGSKTREAVSSQCSFKLELYIHASSSTAQEEFSFFFFFFRCKCNSHRKSGIYRMLHFFVFGFGLLFFFCFLFYLKDTSRGLQSNSFRWVGFQRMVKVSSRKTRSEGKLVQTQPRHNSTNK